ncbi:MAG: DUF4250 domain-containing protein [Oscillospiraceae bacterium]|nr:DUF4250 domain-containing protein [Oscillospiraceae bacterium]
MLPNDPVMLLSVVNTKLRDEYCSLEELCIAEDVKENNLTEKLVSIDYRYDPKINQFI